MGPLLRRIAIEVLATIVALLAGATVAGAADIRPEPTPMPEATTAGGWASLGCEAALHHQVAFDTGRRAYVVRAIEVRAPNCADQDIRVTISREGSRDAAAEGDLRHGAAVIALSVTVLVADVGSVGVEGQRAS